MDVNSDLSKISKITENIYLSGVYPLDENYYLIKQLNIKYILSCVDRNYIGGIHEKIMIDNPDITILYLPYNDEIDQNLWKRNEDKINIVKYSSSVEDYNILRKQLEIYKNKPMIEIAYHFINNLTFSNKNILVHCMAGISRSVSLVIYYLMKKYNMSYITALDIIKNKRIIANPNDSFKLQLLKYQEKRENFNENDANTIISLVKYNMH